MKENNNDDSSLEFTQKEIWNEIQSLKKAANSPPPDINTLLKHFLTKHDLTETEEIREALKYQLKRYKEAKKSASKSEAASKSVVLVVETAVEKTEPPAAKKKRKSFGQLTPKWKRARTDALLDAIEKLVEEENSCNKSSDEDLTVTNLLGYFIHRVNYENDKKIANVGRMMYEGKPIELKTNFTTTDAIALMHDLTLTKQQMRTMKAYMSSKGIHFPNTNELCEARKKLRPVIRTELDGHGVSVNYSELINMTTKSLINTIEHSAEITPNDNTLPIQVIYKEGGDTAGSQSVSRSSAMINASDHLFQYSIVPLRVEQDGHLLWKNPSPNSATSCRTVYLLRASEDEDRVIDLVIPDTDRQRSDLQSRPVSVTSDSNKIYTVEYKIHDTMKDLKFKKKLSGIGGGDCIICKSRRSDWKDPDKIREGFPITRTAEESRELFNQLLLEGDGEILRSANDYDHREGITNKAKTTSDQHSICVLHSYINVLNWFLKVLYRCESGYESWVEKKTVLGEPIRRSKERVKEKLRPAGLVVDQVAGANAKTGTSNTGNTGRDFFLMKNQAIVVSCVERKYKDVIGELHMKIAILLRIVSSCSQAVDCIKLEQLTTDISMRIAEELPWVEINWTLHGLLHHSVELIHLNGGWSLGSLSEEALESNNKFCRRYMEQFARTSSPTLQLTDAMTRVLERSDPSIQRHQQNIRKRLKCGTCGMRHKTSNHTKYEDLVLSTVSLEYDSRVKDYLL